MNLVDLNYVEEAKEYGNRRPKVSWVYYAGIAASFAVFLVSGFLFVFSGQVGDAVTTEEAAYFASVFANSGHSVVFCLVSVLALAIALLLIGFIIQKHKSQRKFD